MIVESQLYSERSFAAFESQLYLVSDDDRVYGYKRIFFFPKVVHLPKKIVVVIKNAIIYVCVTLHVGSPKTRVHSLQSFIWQIFCKS